MSSNLVKFLANLKDKNKWKKAAKAAGLTKDEMRVLKSGDAAMIEAYLSHLYGDEKDKPVTQQGP